MANRRTPKVFYSSYSQTQRGRFGPETAQPGQLRQLLIVAIIIVGGYFLTRLPVFQVKTIALEGSDDAALIAELDSLKGRSILSAGVTEKVQEVGAAHPELGELSCIKGIPNTLRCAATVRQAQLGWLTNGQVFLLDQYGIAFQQTATPAVPVVEDRKNVAVALGDQPISSEVLIIYQDIKTRLAESGYTIEKFFVNTSVLHAGVIVASRSPGLPFPAHPIEVEFSLSYPVSIQISTLNKLLESKSGQIGSRVDLRTPGYLYYK